MTSVNINILGISELKWMRMGEFNSDDHCIYCCGKDSLRRNKVALIVNKRVQNAVLGCNLKNDRMILVHFQGKQFNITVIQVYFPTTNAEEVEVDQYYDSLQDLIKLTFKSSVLFIIGDWNAKVKSRDTWNNRQVSPWNIPGQRLTFLSREHTSHSKNPFPTTQEKTLQWT